jgi:hypothetical protein
MKTKCFSCQNDAPYSLKNSLQIHKDLYEKTGVVYWFFKEEENGKVKIADNESFNKILPKIKDNIGVQWCHIAEFGTTADENILRDNPNEKLETAKPKSKRGTTKRSLD